MVRNAILLLSIMALLAVAAPASVPFGLGGTNTVQDITSFKDLKQILVSDNEVYLLLVGDSLDLNSVRLRLLADEVAAELHGFVTVAFLDVRVPDVDFILSSWNVQAIPSWKLIPAARTTRPNGLGGLKTPVDYKETSMTVESLKRFALQGIPQHKGLVDRIDKDMDLATLHSAVAKAGVNVTLLITDKDKAPSVLYRRLAHKFVQRMVFVDVVAPQCPKLARALTGGTKSLPELPVIVVYNTATKAVTTYTGGAFNVNKLTEWLSGYAITDVAYQQKRAQEKEAAIHKLATAKGKKE
ncbi:bacterial-type sensor protein, putative [Bodo saltans]|uniref:Bacterial-type sensor protein, putative n=1 Tax=Bodo saltans TaxID=75058 RepID=A0A0S4KKX7_BODSA|nr:bacterial-type sensor protein, putative [Bodo saltans]|eukprot:CUI15015.1 bacterial-type sensor protein, putative [Bodo saltans]